MAASNYDIREQVKYTQDGKLFWVKCRRAGDLGKECGWLDQNGYRMMKLGFKNISVHRVIWFIHHNEWPAKGMDIDHINQNKTDNRIENLRVVHRKTNSLNNSASNVSKNRGTFRARVAGTFVGNFKTEDEAKQAAKMFKDSLLNERVKESIDG